VPDGASGAQVHSKLQGVGAAGIIPIPKWGIHQYPAPSSGHLLANP
jgi:hypothetical protein